MLSTQRVTLHSDAVLACASCCDRAGADTAAPLVVASADCICCGRHLARTLPAAGRDSSSVVCIRKGRQGIERRVSGETYKSGRHLLTCSDTSLVLEVGT